MTQKKGQGYVGNVDYILIILTYVFWNLFGKILIMQWSTLHAWYACDCIFIAWFPVVQVSSSLEQRKPAELWFFS